MRSDCSAAVPHKLQPLPNYEWPEETRQVKYGELLERRGVRERWYAFEAAATQRALREWAEEAGFSVKD